MTLPPAIVIHGLTQARLALAPGKPVTLLSAPGAASFAGCAWWHQLIGQAGAEHVPNFLDCADAPGRALEALSIGCRGLILRPCSAWASVAERAEASSVLILPKRPEALDLADSGAARRIEAWLGIG